MMTLLQLIRHFKDAESRDGLMSWCELIKDDANEAFEFKDYLDDCYGIELSDTQVQGLIRVCANGSYKSAFVQMEVISQRLHWKR